METRLTRCKISAFLSFPPAALLHLPFRSFSVRRVHQALILSIHELNYIIKHKACCVRPSVKTLRQAVSFLSVCRTKQLEGKLATLTVINGALQNENESLRQELAKARTPSSTTDAELHELQEEFTRRLAAADRTITSLRVCPQQTRIVSYSLTFHFGGKSIRTSLVFRGGCYHPTTLTKVTILRH